MSEIATNECVRRQSSHLLGQLAYQCSDVVWLIFQCYANPWDMFTCILQLKRVRNTGVQAFLACIGETQFMAHILHPKWSRRFKLQFGVDRLCVDADLAAKARARDAAQHLSPICSKIRVCDTFRDNSLRLTPETHAILKHDHAISDCGRHNRTYFAHFDSASSRLVTTDILPYTDLSSVKLALVQLTACTLDLRRVYVNANWTKYSFNLCENMQSLTLQFANIPEFPNSSDGEILQPKHVEFNMLERCCNIELECKISSKTVATMPTFFGQQLPVSVRNVRITNMVIAGDIFSKDAPGEAYLYRCVFSEISIISATSFHVQSSNYTKIPPQWAKHMPAVIKLALPLAKKVSLRGAAVMPYISIGTTLFANVGHHVQELWLGFALVSQAFVDLCCSNGTISKLTIHCCTLHDPSQRIRCVASTVRYLNVTGNFDNAAICSCPIDIAAVLSTATATRNTTIRNDNAACTTVASRTTCIGFRTHLHKLHFAERATFTNIVHLHSISGNVVIDAATAVHVESNTTISVDYVETLTVPNISTDAIMGVQYLQACFTSSSITLMLKRLNGLLKHSGIVFRGYFLALRAAALSVHNNTCIVEALRPHNNRGPFDACLHAMFGPVWAVTHPVLDLLRVSNINHMHRKLCVYITEYDWPGRRYNAMLPWLTETYLKCYNLSRQHNL